MRGQRNPHGPTTGRQFFGRTGDTDSQPGPAPYRRSAFGGMARDGETSGLLERRCAGVIGSIAIGSFSDAPERRAGPGAE